MKIPERWLRAYVDPAWSSEELSDALTMAGLEVEQVAPFAPPFDRVVIAEVMSVEPHPDADKLKVCQVRTGKQATHTIVCGAPNVVAGIRVPCALPGAQLPGGVTISQAKVRGVASEGMLCSARELGFSDDHSGLLVLPDDAPIGAGIRSYLSLDEPIHELKLTPNRADCLSIYGVAREVSAISGAALRPLEVPPVAVAIDEVLPVRIEAPDLCGRFCGRIIRGVNARARTPDWIRERLERAGQRSISALVDLSNYVMLELGRPTHVFDLNKVKGGLQVRWGRPGEQLLLLNGQTVTVDAEVGVIADDQGLESLAGIMGGESTAVSLDTTDVYVEAAFWWPAAVAGRSRRFNFSTDAGHRFERGVDAQTTAVHLNYLTALIIQVCGGRAGPLDDQIVAMPPREPVTMRIARAQKVIGVPIPPEEMARSFERLGFEFVRQGDSFKVTPPSYRFDIEIEEDLIEEVVRLWGFERLPIRAPRASSSMRPVSDSRRSVNRLKRMVAARDYQEVVGFSFVDSKVDGRLTSEPAIRLLNPIAAQMDVMRTSMLGGLLETLRYNLNRKAERVRLFEVGRVYFKRPQVAAGPLTVNGVEQPLRLGLLASGGAQPEQWASAARPVDFFDVKADLESLLGRAGLRFDPAAFDANFPADGLHPGRSAALTLAGLTVGRIGVLHPALQQALELPLAPVVAEVDLPTLLEVPALQFQDISRFPPAIRDLAVVVADHFPAQRVLDEIAAAIAGNACAMSIRNVRLFDEYRGKGLENKEKSLAFRFWMQDTEKTLSEAQVAEAMAAVLSRLESTLGARLRS